MKNVPLLFATLGFTIVLIVGVVWFFSKNNSEQTIADRAVVESSKRHHKGSESPVVTIVEYSDFQCPACKASQPLVEQIMQKYGDKVQLVFRNYPLVSIHRNALLAAQVAEAASQQDKFWQIHDLLFRDQTKWESMDESKFMDLVGQYADELQIDKNVLLGTIQSSDVKDQVTLDISDGNKLKLEGTPTYFVNGVKTAAPQLSNTVESFVTQK